MARDWMKWGKIVVCYDEWPLSDQGFAAAPDVATYVANVLNWFKGGTGGKFLVYSNDFALTGARLRAAVTAAGHTLVQDTSRFDLQTLLGYDGVFVGQTAADNGVLAQYVDAGGCVYVASGTLPDGGDARLWNTFLQQFGLSITNTNDGSYNVTPALTSPNEHPIMKGVSTLFFSNGAPIALPTDHPAWSQATALWGNKIVVATADVGLTQDTWNDGVIEVTHTYRSGIRKGTNVSGGSVSIKNLTTQLTLQSVALTVDVDDSDPNWDARLCDQNGNFKKARPVQLAAQLAPQAAVSYDYYYFTAAEADPVPGPMTVNIEVLPAYNIAYQKGRAAATVPQQISKSATADAPNVTYPNTLTDADQIIAITSFQYSPSVAENDHIVRGQLTVTPLVSVKSMSVTVGVDPDDGDYPYYDESSCDPEGNSDGGTWFPSAVPLTKPQSATFIYQYSLEATVDNPPKQDFTVGLHILPKITVKYTDLDAFKSPVQASD